MNKTKTTNGIMWSCIAFSVFMVIHLYAIKLQVYSSTVYSLVVELSMLPLAALFFLVIKKFTSEGRSFTGFMLFKRAGITNVIFSILSVLLIVPLSSVLVLLNDLIVRLIVQNPIPIPDSTQYMLDYGFGPAILMFAVLPAVCEEIFFRGYVLGATSSYSKPVIIIFNGFLFSLAHLSMYRIIDTFVLGMVFAYVALKTKSIWPSMIMHFVNNGSRVALLFLLYNSGLLEYAGESAIQGTPPAEVVNPTTAEIAGAILVGIIFVALAILCFIGALLIISRMRNYAAYKRWLYGMPEEPELPNGKDKIAKPVQLLFVLPALAVFILLATFQVVEIPAFTDILRFIWGV